MIIALRALGNAGHPGSIKTIINFLPGVAANPVDVSCRVQSAAMQALRLTARRDPHNVRTLHDMQLLLLFLIYADNLRLKCHIFEAK